MVDCYLVNSALLLLVPSNDWTLSVIDPRMSEILDSRRPYTCPYTWLYISKDKKIIYIKY